MSGKQEDLRATALRSLAYRDTIYDVLVRECGAQDNESMRGQWAAFWKRAESANEFRFMGALGFGGKVWVGRHEPPYVTCYPEDETASRQAMIEAANVALADLEAGFLQPQNQSGSDTQ